MADTNDTQDTSAGLGTFAGVFTPSVLTILGIILFLRMGYVVGNAGLAQALIIVGLANLISVLTSVSLSAVATNLKVKGGGDYYLISRTLGVAYGGAIGIVLFLAQSVSIAFYCIGFGEALAPMLPDYGFISPQSVAVLAVAFLFILAWLGADWATKFQFVVMTLLVAALASFYLGAIPKWDEALLAQNWAKPDNGLPFWAIFAIFFPAVTGFTQGVSMSGDLKDPGRSLPLGTFMAVGISIVVYLSATALFAAAMPAQTLMGDYGAMGRISRFSVLIDAGVIAATLSSAMASFLGAPRILQSLAGDRIFPFLLPFAKGFGPTGNPRRGVLLSAGIALVVIALGNLNLIARVVSMFFLISYGLLNYATFFEARTASPSFRPRFRWFDYRLSLLGFLACLGVMLAIDPATGVAAIAVLVAIYQYIKRTAGPARWADSQRAYHLQRIREHLLNAAAIPEHSRNWRPQILALSNTPEGRRELLRFSSWLEGNSGMSTVVSLLEGEGLQMLKRRKEAEAELKIELAAYESKAFPLVLFAPSMEQSVHTLVQAFGIGPLQANILLLQRPSGSPGHRTALEALRQGKNLRIAFRHGCNIVVFSFQPSFWEKLRKIPPDQRRIDVWWWNDASSRMMLLLAFLMTRNPEWEGAAIRLLAVAGEPSAESEPVQLEALLEEARIEAQPEVIENVDEDRIAAYSRESALVFLPFRLRGNHMLTPFGNDPEILLTRLPATALVLAAEDIDLDEAPEEGEAGDVAEALDAHEDASKRARQTEKEAQKAQKELEEVEVKLMALLKEAEPDPERLAELESRVKTAKDHVEKATRKAAKARGKQEIAAQEAEAKGIPVEGKEPTSSAD
jgi:amino acid transporter